MCYSKYLISLWQILLFILGLQGCLVSYLPDMFLLPVFFFCLLKTCQTDLKCFMHIIMKTTCLVLRLTVQKLSVESGLACDSMYLHVCWEHVPAQFTAVHQPLSSRMGTGFRRCAEGAPESPFVKLLPPTWWEDWEFSWSEMELAPFPCSAKSSLPKMTFSSSWKYFWPAYVFPFK